MEYDFAFPFDRPVRKRTDWAPAAFDNAPAMPKCDACGNDYDKYFHVLMRGKTHTFDSFECAIHMLAPVCAHCGVRIVGHGLEKDGHMYCCDHCAEKEGVMELRDRA